MFKKHNLGDWRGVCKPKITCTLLSEPMYDDEEMYVPKPKKPKRLPAMKLLMELSKKKKEKKRFNMSQIQSEINKIVNQF